MCAQVSNLNYGYKARLSYFCLLYRVFGLSSDFKEGIVFSTYATLVSSVQRGEKAGGGRGLGLMSDDVGSA